MPAGAELAAALAEALAGRVPDPALTEAFAGHRAPVLDDAAPLAAFARGHFDALLGATRAEPDGLRHLLVFALGFTGDPRCTGPLIDLLVDPLDAFDHDWCYQALGRLGEVAFQPLFAIAAGNDPERAVQAVQALGQSRADALPVLRRVLLLPELPAGVFSALYNTHDPAALPDLERGLWHADPEHRSEAMFTAYCLLEIAREEDPGALAAIDRRRWGDRMLELYADEELEERPVALTAIGLLGEVRHLPRLVAEFDLVEDDDDAVDRVVAIGWLHAPESRAWLVDRLGETRRSVAGMAAVMLARDAATGPDVLERAADTMLEVLLADAGDQAWCDVRTTLPASALGRVRLFGVIAGGDPGARELAIESLRRHAEREEVALVDLLRGCPPQVAARVRAAAESD